MSTNISLTGVNLSGAEFDPGGSYYEYPTQAEIDYEAFKGMNVIRVPVEWERLQPTLGGALDPGQLQKLDAVISEAAKDGLKVVIDLHNYGKYDGNLITEGSVTNAQFADFWGKMATHYAGASNVIYGLMNEPAQTNAHDWINSVNAAIQAIRYSSVNGVQTPLSNQEVLVSGINYDHANNWVGTDNANVIGTGVIDPVKNYAFEVHQYLDSDGSGTHYGPVSDTQGSDTVTSITNWARTNGQKLFLGEIGVSSDQTSLTALNNVLSYLNDNADVWQGVTYWAAGPLWKPFTAGDGTTYADYPYSAEPTPDAKNTANDGYDDKPQQTVLDQYAHATGVACFASGTLIRTARGEVAVETLAVGDIVVTASGEHRAVRWMGHRSYIGRFANANPDVLPICVHAGALADGEPRRDLWVSPKHALFLDSVLIPAEHLVNGATITKASRVEAVEYWHVELDSHDVLVAEGVPAESFVDDNGRGIFQNAHTFADLYPDAVRTEAAYCAPRVENGFALDAVRRRLATRAGLPVGAGPRYGALAGFVERVEGGAVHGWAAHAGLPGVPVCLDVLVGGAVVGLALAEVFRDDLLSAGIGEGRHGFRFALPGDASGEVQVRRSVDGAALPRLACAPVLHVA